MGGVSQADNLELKRIGSTRKVFTLKRGANYALFTVYMEFCGFPPFAQEAARKMEHGLPGSIIS